MYSFILNQSFARIKSGNHFFYIFTEIRFCEGLCHHCKYTFIAIQYIFLVWYFVSCLRIKCMYITVNYFQRPEVVEDFVRNFLVKMGMNRTLDCFQTEWWVPGNPLTLLSNAMTCYFFCNRFHKTWI